MEKRYQVFISSTFMDLKNARQEVSQALLRTNCFPAGMELFPAADEEQFEFIKTIINQSDYYILISAGRYGTIHPETGLSYTEMEYDYAVEIGKPVIRLLFNEPNKIADEGDEKLAQLLQFRTKLKNGRMVAFWETPDQLGKEATFALLEAIKTKSAVGWVRSDEVLDGKVSIELASLRSQVARHQENQKSDSPFVTGDESSKRIKAALDDMSGYIADKRAAYETLLDNIANDIWRYDRMDSGEVIIAKQLFPVLLAFGSIQILEGQAGINERSYADFGYASL
jgi:hypothetical protein|tara:strand:+ start:746 stop:1594 length:849 start_codon:yes stop_codon:yes gene_type:complete